MTGPLRGGPKGRPEGRPEGRGPERRPLWAPATDWALGVPACPRAARVSASLPCPSRPSRLSSPLITDYRPLSCLVSPVISHHSHRVSCLSSCPHSSLLISWIPLMPSHGLLEPPDSPHAPPCPLESPWTSPLPPSPLPPSALPTPAHTPPHPSTTSGSPLPHPSDSPPQPPGLQILLD